VARTTSSRGATATFVKIAADGFGGPNIQTTNPRPYPVLGVHVFSMNNLLHCLKMFCSPAYVGLRCSPLCFPSTTFPCCGTNLDRRPAQGCATCAMRAAELTFPLPRIITAFWRLKGIPVKHAFRLCPRHTVDQE
jgi:hypothetical protein